MVQEAQSLSHGATPTAPASVKAVEAAGPLAQNLKKFGASAAYFLGSCLILVAMWALLCATFAKDLPGPPQTARSLMALFAQPFYVKADGTMGVGNLVIASLGRVGLGFGIGGVLAIPLGILMGAVPVFKRLADPIVQLLRPVSPLAWFPLSQVIFRSMGNGTTPAAIVATIAITSLWPTLINTAFGVASLPEDYRTVARVFQFSRARYLTKVLIPYSLPHILTGLRLSMGVAWLVIVAAEMLSGSSGIGFSAYDAYNQGRLDDMMATIIVIGMIGLVLDRGFDFLARHLDYEKGNR